MSNSYANIYHHPELAEYLDSAEGVPAWPAIASDAGADSASTTPLNRFRLAFAALGDWLPGLGLAVGIAWCGYYTATWGGQTLLGMEHSPISSVAAIIVIGMLVRQVLGMPKVYLPGLRLCARRLLRVGVALLGIRLGLGTLGQIGLWALPLTILIVTVAITLAMCFTRWMRLGPKMGLLIGAGTGICGVSAIAAVTPAIDAKDNEASYAIACVTLYGLTGVLAYPWLAHLIFDGQPIAAGMFVGVAIHDTAQVAAAGLLYQQQFDAPATLDAATVTKLVRNMSLIWAVPALATIAARLNHSNKPDATGRSQPIRLRWRQTIPLFVIAFVTITLIRTLGDTLADSASWWPESTWLFIVDATSQTATTLLMLAMAAIGMSTSLSTLRGMGMKPLVVGGMTAFGTGVIGLMIIKFLLF